MEHLFVIRLLGISRTVIIATFSILVVLFSMGLHTIPAAMPFNQPSAVLTEWQVPTPRSGPTALTLDQSGSCCWFLESSGNKLSHFDPSTNTFQEWSIPTKNANPFGLAVSSVQGSAALWGTEFSSDKIFEFSLTQSILREYHLPQYNDGAEGISIEPGGTQVRVWFTEAIRNTNGEIIYAPSTGNITLYEDTFPAAVGGGAYDVYAESNSVWFAGFSSIVRWDRASQQYTIWQLPIHGSAVGRFVTLDRYGQAWYTEGSENATSNDNFVGVLRGGSTLQEWRLPAPGADPVGVSINPTTQQPWIAERSLSAANGAIAVLSNSSGGTILTPAVTTAPSAGTPVAIAPTVTNLTVSTTLVNPTETSISAASSEVFAEYSLGASSPRDVVIDSKGNIWISEPAKNKIARLSGFSPDFALGTYPQIISIPQGGSGTVPIVGTSISGYGGTLTLGPVNLPNGVGYSLDPKQIDVSAGENASSTLAIQVDSNTPPGTIQVAFQGGDGTISHSLGILLTITNGTTTQSSTSKCLIATATFGSQLGPQIELLRNFRTSVTATRAGESFLLIFNTWYYSFSPYVATYVGTHPNTRGITQAVLYPLIQILTAAADLYTVLPAYSEYATLLTGLLASSTIGVIYLGLPLTIIKRKFKISTRTCLWICGSLLTCGLCGILLGLNLENNVLLMTADAFTVLSTICGSAALTAELLDRMPWYLKQLLKARSVNKST